MVWFSTFSFFLSVFIGGAWSPGGLRARGDVFPFLVCRAEWVGVMVGRALVILVGELDGRCGGLWSRRDYIFTGGIISRDGVPIVRGLEVVVV